MTDLHDKIRACGVDVPEPAWSDLKRVHLLYDAMESLYRLYLIDCALYDDDHSSREEYKPLIDYLAQFGLTLEDVE